MCRNVCVRSSVLCLRRGEEEFRDGVPGRDGRLSVVSSRPCEPMTQRPLSLRRQAHRIQASLCCITIIVSCWCGSRALAETPEDQAAFRSYKQLCSQVRRGTWEMRTTLCAM